MNDRVSGAVHPFEGHRPTLAPDVFIAPGAQVVGRVTIGPESSVWYNCVLRGDVHEITVGARSNIQDGTVVHVTGGRFGSHIGDDVLIGHLCMIHGCTIEDGAFVGMKATVLDGCVIEKGAMLAAGALLTPGKRIPSGELWAGAPARYMRDLDEAQVAANRRGAEGYRQLAGRHRSSLIA